MPNLGPYPSEVQAIADELSELLVGERYDAAFSISRGGLSDLMTMSDDDLQKALRFLKSTPSQRIKTLANKAAHDAALLILRARYLGLCSAKALFFVDRIYVVGAGYREAAERGARHAYKETLRPTLEELLPAPRRREPGWDW